MDPDIELELHFLDCQPQSILHSLTSNKVFEHLYRAASERILRDQPNPSNRVTDIDQLIFLDPSSLFPSAQRSIEIPIEVIRNRSPSVSVSPQTIDQTTGIVSTPENASHIPPAPPLPPSFDVSSTLRDRTPDQATIWANVSLKMTFRQKRRKIMLCRFKIKT